MGMIKRGDWVASTDGNRCPQIAWVREAWIDEYGPCANLVFYSYEGERLGRISPAEGGPVTYDPACPVENWGRIEEPEFPLRRLGLMGEWASQLTFLEG